MNKVSGYTEIALPNGTVVPLKFGMWTMQQLCKRWQINLKDIQKEMQRRMEEDQISVVFDLVGTAAEYAARVAGKPQTFDEAVVSSWIDDTGGLGRSPVISQAMTAFAEGMGVEYAEPKNEGEQVQSEGNSPAPQGH